MSRNCFEANRRLLLFMSRANSHYYPGLTAAEQRSSKQLAYRFNTMTMTTTSSPLLCSTRFHSSSGLSLFAQNMTCAQRKISNASTAPTAAVSPLSDETTKDSGGVKQASAAIDSREPPAASGDSGAKKAASCGAKAAASSVNGGFKSSSAGKKKSESSEARERSNTMRFFYLNPEIDKAAQKPLVRLNPMTMMYMGVSDDYSHLLQSANYLRNELPIRLAHMIKEMRNLPFIVGCNPSMLEIHERCIKAFNNFDNFDKEIKDLSTEKRFNQHVCNMLEMNKDLLALLCDGFRDTRRYIKNEDFIKHNLNKILSARMGIRLLCEHHIALNKQSNIDPTQTGEDEDGCGERSASSSSANERSTSSTNCLSESSSRSAKTEDWVGIIHKKFSPKKLVETSGRMVSRICQDKYGQAPKLKIDGHTNVVFPYIPLPLEYILPELLKNSFRATCEQHRGSATLPDVNVTIAINEKDCILRIRDRGGGIPHALTNKIFDYHFSTAGEDSSTGNDVGTGASAGSSLSAASGGSYSNLLPLDQHQNQATSNDNFMGDGGFQQPNEAVGMLCETASCGLAVMHGYGFGLPTSKAYAEYLGGSLSFQSMQGIGSDFYLRMALLDIEPEMVRI